MSVVEQASEWGRWMIGREAKGPGDIDAAMRRIESRYGVPYSVLWSLRYRPPADILASVYLRLQAAHDDMRTRQEQALRHEFTVTQVRSRAAAALVRAARSLAGKAD